MNLRPRLCTVLVLISSFLFIATDAHAFPAFARKYGLRCSACHVAWPILNDFGWRFKDNGYQLMNDRDAPIWQNPSYWPVSFRMTPNWHRETAQTRSKWIPLRVRRPVKCKSRRTVSTTPVSTSWQVEPSTRTSRSCLSLPPTKLAHSTSSPFGHEWTICFIRLG